MDHRHGLTALAWNKSTLGAQDGGTDLLVSNVIRDYGDRALLLECESTDEVLALAAALNQAQVPGVLDIVPASRTVLLELSGPRDQAPARQLLARLQVDPAGLPPPTTGTSTW